MIPLKLALRNFLSYRGEMAPLDFSSIRVACLTGDNGHGKSALLDAITWALWGKARARRDVELITLGESEMEVEFEFSLGKNTYRVIRKRDSRKRARSILELQVKHAEEYRSLTEPSIRETQAAINSILRMDYETFINSSFLLQGRADEFTIKPPAERKQVLADILGLDQYDEYEQRAKKLARTKGLEQHELAVRIQEMDRELANRSRYALETEETQTSVQQATEALAQEGEHMEELRSRAQALQLRRQRLLDLEASISAQQKELSLTREEIDGHTQRLRRHRETLARRDEIEAGFQRLHAARIAEQRLGEQLSQLLELNEKRETEERAVADATADLKRQQLVLIRQAEELRPQAAKHADLEAHLSRTREGLKRLAELEAERDETRGEIRALIDSTARLETANDQLMEEMQRMKERIDRLEGASAVCPLCGQDLSPDHRHRVVAELRADGKQCGERYRANKRATEEAQQTVVALRQRIGRLDAEIRGTAHLRKEEGKLEHAVADALAATQQVPSLEQEAAALSARLADEALASEARARLGEIQAQIVQLGYDAQAHQALRAELAELSRFEAQKREQETALRQAEEEEAALKILRATEERDRLRLAQDENDRDALTEEVKALPQVLEQLRAAKKRLEALGSQQAEARLLLGAARQKLEHCDYLKGERESVQKRERQAAEDRNIYEDLRLAFGKRGLQAMIIEAVMPEIEDEANALLSRMTDSRMHVQFDTQRRTLKGDTVETLDINISDELGPRSYELYSGGEAFRINFAIRIALSKLLARRAGAELQTLVIDEGFGTQDAGGRERLLEAINTIRDDFARILVITHVEELRDAFPTRIDVVKTASGSTVHIGM